MVKKVFYSFHFDNDVMRVQQIRNIGSIEDNKPVSANEWETVRRGSDAAIEKWIEENMKYRDCVVVLIGKDTADRKWVKHEIKKAWNDKRGLVGIYIHNLKCPRTGICTQGKNPFDQFNVSGTPLSSIVRCYNPNSWDTYGDIKSNLETWVDEAIRIRSNH